MASKKLALVLDAMLYIAYNGHSEPISSKEIAEKLGVQQRYLEQMMQRLVHEGVLKGVRGPRGGYLLARERRRINLADIFELIRDEEDFAQPFSEHGTNLGKALLKPLFADLHQHMVASLKEHTLESLCQEARHQNIPHAHPERLDFHI